MIFMLEFISKLMILVIIMIVLYNVLVNRLALSDVVSANNHVHQVLRSHEPRHGRRLDQRIDRLALIRVLA